jgi:hypothetical protein
MVRGLRRAASLALAAAIVVGSAPALGASPAAAAAVSGTYRMHATGRVEAGPVLSRRVEERGDAILRPDDGPRAVRARLAAHGHACELVATVEATGELRFEPGQRCVFDVREDDARGKVEARLGSGRGRVRDRTLTLELAWELSGTLSVRTPERLEILGQKIELGSGWTPDLPVRGTARIEAEGTRDDSRATER